MQPLPLPDVGKFTYVKTKAKILIGSVEFSSWRVKLQGVN